MREADLKAVAILENLPVLDECEPKAKSITANSASKIAEAADMVRLHELLHRHEYQPLAVIRYRRDDGECVCVYFRRLDDT